MPLMRRIVALAAFNLMLAVPALADGAALSAALASGARGDWASARAAVEGKGDIAADIVDWHRLRAGKGSFDEARAFLDRRPDWPGLALLAEKAEAAIPRGGAPAPVLEFFAGRAPQTGRGALRLAEAYAATGQPAAAETAIVTAWQTMLLDSEEQAAFLERHGALLDAYHEARFDMLLWRGASLNARAMFSLVNDDLKRLAEARIALRQKTAGVDGAIAAVPKSLSEDAGLAFERFLWRAEKGRNADAIALALERSGSAESLGQPERWASWRATLARWAMREGQVDTAYRLAASHQLRDGSDYAELEWLAGFIALRLQNAPEKALKHFRAFRVAVASPISLGRAGYWEGRALEAMGDAEAAQAAYEFGGEHQTSFYGLLAAEKAGLPMDASLATGGPEFGDWTGADFARSSVLRAALMLFQAGEPMLGTRFMLQLAENFDTRAYGQLSDLALKIRQPYTAVALAKQAAQRNIVLPRAYFPLTGLETESHPVPVELVMAIARRESEFNPSVVSGAGARGLMQVMPGTAQDMARSLGVAYDRARLTTDPAYNARLGGAYLRNLIDQFGDQPVLVAVGYNAGPGRSRSWTRERGHPGAEGVDVIDWIEMIPFTETRNYVMRVTESLPVYRARLTGKASPIRFSAELKGS